MPDMYQNWLSELRKALVKVRHELNDYCGIEEQKPESQYYCIKCGKYFESFAGFDGHRGRRECVDEVNA